MCWRYIWISTLFGNVIFVDVMWIKCSEQWSQVVILTCSVSRSGTWTACGCCGLCWRIPPTMSRLDVQGKVAVLCHLTCGHNHTHVLHSHRHTDNYLWWLHLQPRNCHYAVIINLRTHILHYSLMARLTANIHTTLHLFYLCHDNETPANIMLFSLTTAME